MYNLSKSNKKHPTFTEKFNMKKNAPGPSYVVDLKHFSIEGYQRLRKRSMN